jgi:hypothetical protein
MAKEINDKYYTPRSAALKLIKLTQQILKGNITDVIEPSAGNGSFSTQIKCTAYDLYPEHRDVIKQDFLTLKLPYKKGRLFIGNPPFGGSSALSKRFVKHALTMGDYVAFIMPASQYEIPLNNTRLLYSDRLNLEYLEGSYVPGVFNIYTHGTTVVALKEVTVWEIGRGKQTHINIEADYIMCAWGSSVGKRVFKQHTFAAEICVKIHNRVKIMVVFDVLSRLRGTKSKSGGTYRLTTRQVENELRKAGIR